MDAVENARTQHAELVEGRKAASDAWLELDEERERLIKERGGLEKAIGDAVVRSDSAERNKLSKRHAKLEKRLEEIARDQGILATRRDQLTNQAQVAEVEVTAAEFLVEVKAGRAYAETLLGILVSELAPVYEHYSQSQARYRELYDKLKREAPSKVQGHSPTLSDVVGLEGNVSQALQDLMLKVDRSRTSGRLSNSGQHRGDGKVPRPGKRAAFLAERGGGSEAEVQRGLDEYMRERAANARRYAGG
jgi:seryl-tRNA synthetase